MSEHAEKLTCTRLKASQVRAYPARLRRASAPAAPAAPRPSRDHAALPSLLSRASPPCAPRPSPGAPRHAPAVVLAVDDIPRTRSGKISEIAVRDTVHGRPVKNTAALANPESLAQFRDRPELG